MPAMKTIIALIAVTVIFSGLLFLFFLKLPIQLDFNGKGIFFYAVFSTQDLDFKGLRFGYASFPADGHKQSDLLHLADLKMYEIKNRKRNITS